MENASKALIIAGAILLSILVIGLGMFIYQQASDVLGSVNMNAQEVQAYNSEFLAYEGTQRGSNAIALVNKIIAHNNTYTDDVSRQISVATENTDYTTESYVTAPDSAVTGISTVKSGLKSGYTYYVSFATDQQSGLITAVNLRRVTTGGGSGT